MRKNGGEEIPGWELAFLMYSCKLEPLLWRKTGFKGV